jgi:hypothetical protein
MMMALTIVPVCTGRHDLPDCCFSAGHSRYRTSAPAAGIALGMALSPSIQLNLTGAALAVIAAVLASLLKHALAPRLKDLI